MATTIDATPVDQPLRIDASNEDQASDFLQQLGETKERWHLEKNSRAFEWVNCARKLS
jgi:hypothetical protein